MDFSHFWQFLLKSTKISTTNIADKRARNTKSLWLQNILSVWLKSEQTYQSEQT